MAKVISTIRVRRNTAAAWTAGNAILLQGEPGLETDTGKLKIGDGVSDWANLPYFGAATTADLTDVTITGPIADNEVLAYNLATTQWTNQTLAEAGIQPAGSYAAASHTHFATDINSYTTAGTGATDNNKWTKFASVTLTSQYAESESVLQFVSSGDGSTTVAGAKIRIKVKQQVAFGGNPYVHIAVEQGANLAPANFYATIVQNTPTSIVDFYIQIPETYRAYRFYPIVTSGTITWLQNQAWIVSVPAGVATVAALADFGTIYGAVSASSITASGTINSGAITADGGGSVIKLKPGTADHAYLEYYADSSAASTRSGWVGYGSAGTSQMSITNEMPNGNINLSTNGTGTVTINGAIYAPPGMLTQYVGSTAPTGWLLCDGTEKAIATYSALYAVIGTTYGPLTNGAGAAGTTHFRVPDLRGRIPMGAGTGAGDGASGTNTLPAGTALTARTLGAWGGAQGTSLTVSHIPQHAHAIDHDHVAFTTASGGGHEHTYFMDDGASIYGGATLVQAIQYDATSSPAGNGGKFYTQGGGAHTHSIDVPAFTGTSGNYGTATVTPVPTVPPFIVVNYIIKT